MRFFLFIKVCLFSFNLFAQGVHFSDNREIPMQLNPAFTGVIHGDYVHRAVLSHRRQGNATLGRNEFETYYISYDRKISLCEWADGLFVGVGLEVVHDQVGMTFGGDAQYFHRQEANLNTSLGIQLGEGNYLIGGARAGLLSRGLSGENLTFDSQFDGRDFDGNLATMEAFENDRLFYFDLGAGLMLRGSIQSMGGNQLLQLQTYEIGMSFLHLNNKREQYLANTVVEDLEREYRIHAKAALLVNDRFRMIPSLIYYKFGALGSQGRQWQLRPSLEFPFWKKAMLSGGTRISNFAERGNHVEALVFTAKWKPYSDINKSNRFGKDDLIFGISIDINTSPNLARSNRGFGGFEVFLTKYFRGNSNTPPLLS